MIHRPPTLFASGTSLVILNKEIAQPLSETLLKIKLIRNERSCNKIKNSTKYRHKSKKILVLGFRQLCDGSKIVATAKVIGFFKTSGCKCGYTYDMKSTKYKFKYGSSFQCRCTRVYDVGRRAVN